MATPVSVSARVPVTPAPTMDGPTCDLSAVVRVPRPLAQRGMQNPYSEGLWPLYSFMVLADAGRSLSYSPTRGARELGKVLRADREEESQTELPKSPSAFDAHEAPEAPEVTRARERAHRARINSARSVGRRTAVARGAVSMETNLASDVEVDAEVCLPMADSHVAGVELATQPQQLQPGVLSRRRIVGKALASASHVASAVGVDVVAEHAPQSGAAASAKKRRRLSLRPPATC